jgi:hypothetical protein
MGGRTLVPAVAVALTGGAVAALSLASLRSPLPSTVPPIELDAEPTSNTGGKLRNDAGGQGRDRGRGGAASRGTDRGPTGESTAPDTAGGSESTEETP